MFKRNNTRYSNLLGEGAIMKHIIYDTDMIGDDILTLSAIALDPQVHLSAVTTYGRRIGALKRAEIAQRVLDCMNIHGVDIVPGVDAPLMRPSRDGCRLCDDAIDSFMKENPPSAIPLNPICTAQHAAEYIIRKTKESSTPYSLLCTGPLTNIALAVSLDPSLPSRLDNIVIMGGLWKECGNTSAVAEANIYNDPEAARIVFDGIKNITVIGLDVTLQVCAKVSLFTDMHSGKISNLLYNVTHSCCNAHEIRNEGAVMPLHDVLAFYALCDESIVTTKPCTIHVETKSTTSSGMTICDFEDTTQNHKFAVSVDTDRVISLFTDFLKDISTRGI